MSVLKSVPQNPMSELMEKKENALSVGNDSKINVVVNRSSDEDGLVDLLSVFGNMKRKSGFFVWVIVLCMVVGVCAPLLLYQTKKQALLVASERNPKDSLADHHQYCTQHTAVLVVHPLQLDILGP